MGISRRAWQSLGHASLCYHFCSISLTSDSEPDCEYCVGFGLVFICHQSILINCSFWRIIVGCNFATINIDQMYIGKWLQFGCHQSKCWSCLSASKGGFAVPIVLKIPALPRSAWLDPPTRKLLCDFKHLLQRRRRSKVPITDLSSLAQEGAYLPLWVTM